MGESVPFAEALKSKGYGSFLSAKKQHKQRKTMMNQMLHSGEIKQAATSTQKQLTSRSQNRPRREVMEEEIKQ